MLVGFKKRICNRNGCSNIFTPKTKKHLFCCRKCYMLKYRSKDEVFGFPIFKCPVCGKKINLKFNPLKEPAKWARYKCYHCNWRNIDSDYMDIQKIKINWENEGREK